jgi:hypothetical protein
MKQHRHSVNRDLEDEVAAAIEHQYARRLMQGGVKSGGAPEQAEGAAPRKPSSRRDAGRQEPAKETEQRRKKRGF